MPMMRLFCLLLAAALALPVAAQSFDAPLSERRVAYEMDVTLDPATKTVRGEQVITWRNPDQVPVEELQFHLYLNAFSGPNSTFMRESGGRHRGYAATGDDVWGSTRITSLQIRRDAADENAPDLTDALRFIQPDDGNVDDSTVVSLPLPEPVPPGATITLAVAFESKLPKIFARTGWEERADGQPFFMVAQWFPKLGVYEIPGQRYVPPDAPRGQWSTHQFHANSEFYADFGTYDVTMTVPEEYTLGASGARVSEDQTGGTKTITYRAEDVHDFAWTASPAFQTFTDQWRDVRLRLLVQPEHAAQAQRHFDAAKTALEYFDEWVGPYPYETLTLVDGIGGSNGMEYPTLITCGTVYGLPPWVRALEIVTIHEFGHQYFYGLLASNEAEEAWLDEGLNSYLETRIVDAVYDGGSAVGFPGLRIDDGAAQRLAYTKSNPYSGALFTKSWEYRSGDYGKASYSKPATVMHSLERYLGWATMREALRTYYDRWRFRHPTTRDFISVVEDVSGEDLGWFFDQYVYGTAVVDYEVSRLQNQNVTPDGSDERRYQSTVRLRRLEDGTFPQTLRVRFADGRTETRQWDGLGDVQEYTFTGPARLVEAYLDPDNDVWLDINRLNNRRTTERDDTLARKAQFKSAVWFQQLFYLISGVL